jgi:spore germination protein
MIIHIVQAGETINSIAETYHVPVDRLIIENGIQTPENLAVGQTIVIIYPLQTYIIQDGDTLETIANDHNVSVMQLLRNNPYLSDREYIYPGETIVISYDTIKTSSIAISGYAYSFISKDVLKKTLPYLTYLTVFNYRVTAEGEIIDIDDQEVVNMAKEYGVAPMMLVSTISEYGVGSSEIDYIILNNPEVQDRMIDNILNNIKRKGYYGLNLYLQYLRPETQQLVNDLVRKVSLRIKNEGYRLLVTVTPRTNIEGTTINIEPIDYSVIAQYTDAILFLSYDWGYSYGPPVSVTPVNLAIKLLDYILTMVPPEKIFQGLPVIGYDWELPYIPGYTIANAITSDAAVQLAADMEVTIYFNEIAQAPYFFYNDPDLHIVWFKDARSIDTIINIVPEYGLQGTAIWNIMQFFAQMWFIINNTFEIEKVNNLEHL